MSNPPHVSVIIPVYDRAGTIGRAIASVLGQGYGDFELLVVDDGSSDDLGGALAAFSDARLKLLRHERNRGTAAARNTAIRASRGELVAFLDSDDEWLPGKLARQRTHLAACGAGAAVALCGYTLRRDRGGRTEPRPLREVADWYLRLLLACNVSFGSCGLVRRSAFEEFGLFDEALPRFEDWDWLLRVTAKRPIATLSEPLAIVHMGPLWPSIAKVDACAARIWELHREEAARHSGMAERLLRSTIWYERGVARYRHHRTGAAAWCLARALLLHPARSAGLCRNLAERIGVTAPREARPAA